MKLKYTRDRFDLKPPSDVLATSPFEQLALLVFAGRRLSLEPDGKKKSPY